ncbi:hypothetical protein [Streptomyces melanogenes]|uniref:hypothetical protein n=1 Tax=Streptomyces melanogenes TaxID=67326 RepID=UPI0037A271D2
MARPRNSVALAALVCALALTACSSDLSGSGGSGDVSGPARPRSSPAPASTPPVPITYAMPKDVTVLVLPATGAETRWSQGLDAFAQAVGDASAHACAQAHRTALPDRPPPAFIRRAELPDLAFIRRHGFSAVLAPLPYPRGTPTGSASPAGQRCLRQGEDATRGLRSVYVDTQTAWMRELAKVRTAPTVREAYRSFAPCLARHGITATDEAGLFALADRRLAADRTDADLAIAYATCMAPIEAARSPLRTRQRDRFIASHRATLQELQRTLPARIHRLEADLGVRLSFPGG